MRNEKDFEDKTPKSGKIKLSNIFLDPNNYRFRDHEDFVIVEEEKITEPKIQARTRRIIAGGQKSRKGIQDLISSLKKVGFQPVERIKVQKISHSQYKVIEGNRRITALKTLLEDYNNDRDIGNLNPIIFEKVPVDIWEKDDKVNYYLMAGLNHIGGKVKWPAINIATYINDMQNEGYDEDEIRQTFGISKQQYNNYKRALILIEKYKKSDFGDQFHSNKYFVFEEIVKKPQLRDYWLKWETNKGPSHTENMNRLFEWISYREEVIDPDNPESDVKEIPPIINQGRDIRELEKIIKDEEALKVMEESESLVEAISGSSVAQKSKISKNIKNIEKSLSGLKSQSTLIKQGEKSKLVFLLDELEKVVNEDENIKRIFIKKEEQKEIFFKEEVQKNHFTNLSLDNYKLFSGLKLEDLGRINILAGENNTGKTSALEGIYLLTNLNDLRAFMDIQRRRGKFHPGNLSPYWLERESPEFLKITGNFSNESVSLEIEKKYETTEDYDKQAYITTFFSKAFCNSVSVSSKFRIYEGKKTLAQYEKLIAVCKCVYSSPFSFQEPEEVLALYDRAVKKKLDNKIVSFFKESGLDEKIESIKLSKQVDVERFLVQHAKFNYSPDLTSFGDGMQRIFFIALHFANAENGIVLIDEFENAIHHDLLRPFSKFIQILAKEFNVQVFLTSHSKECIDSFFNNNYENNTISTYRFENRENEIIAKKIKGEDFEKLLSSINIDLRG